jgi:hypothetical protein
MALKGELGFRGVENSISLLTEIRKPYIPIFIITLEGVVKVE